MVLKTLMSHMLITEHQVFCLNIRAHTLSLIEIYLMGM
jgi:hypothetical protein